MTDEIDRSVASPELTRDGLVTELFESEYRNLVGLARLLVDAEAEEVVQEGFARLVASFVRVDDPDRATAYLRSTVLNLSRSRLRRRRTARTKAHLVPDDIGGQPPVAPLSAGDRDRVRVAVQDLPRRQQECIVLRFYYDSSEREIAETLGIGAGSVKKHLSRAKQRLADELKGLA